MSATLGQREVGLAGVALLGVVVALAVAHRVHGSTERPAATVRPVVPSVARWTQATAEARTTPARQSACGLRLRADTLGVAHPVLPCRAKIYLVFRGRRILTEIVDRGAPSSAAEFQLTPALARLIGLRGVQPIRWTFARG